jgi:DNA-binding NtrC family response regulator
VLFVGETGVGKTAFAQALHAASARQAGPLVVVDCATLRGDLAHSELFGHVRGAFTGAHVDRLGAIESAHGGTLVLEHVGELESSLQPALLRVLEHKCTARLGDRALRPVDLRVVATASTNLEALVDQGQFRRDLYYRLAVVLFRVPPLRERREDIAAIAVEFGRTRGQALSLATLLELESRPWPGNVRELHNELERRATGIVTPDSQGRGGEPTMREALELTFLRSLLEKHRGNVTRASREAKLSRTHLHRLLKKHGVVGLARSGR